MDLVREAMRQVWEGRDFTPPEKMLRSIKPEAAVAVPAGSPYSIATNVAHADIWQRIWLAKLEGTPRIKPFPDFPVISAEDWSATKASFLENFQKAVEIAHAEPFKHKAKSDEDAASTLLQIGVHNAYHLGQINLLKRLLRSRA